MTFRIGPGPVFVVELIAAARRWQSYALRAGLVLLLLGALGLVYLNFRGDWLITGGKQRLSLGDYARIGTAFVEAVLGTQLALILLVAPAATAGAICIDKARGNLTLLMATDLSTSEIILGKLAARLGPVLLLVATSLPVLFIATMMGGVNIDQLILGFIVLTGAAVFGCSLALCLSVHVGRTQEALLISYFVITIWLLAFPIAFFVNGVLAPMGIWTSKLALLNPYVLLFEPSNPTVGATLNDYLIYAAATCGSAAILVWLSILRLRRIVLQQINRVQKAPRRKRNRKAHVRMLNRDALRWYERHRRRPSKAIRFVWVLYILMGIGCAVVVYFERQTAGMFRWSSSPVNAFLVGFGLLLAVIGAVTALADERTRGSLDILLLAPVLSGAVLWAKWRAAYSIVPKLLILPLVIGLIVVLVSEVPGWMMFSQSSLNEVFHYRLRILLLLVVHPLACGAMLVSLGLLLATWLRKFGRAVGIAVAMYVFLVLVWPIVAQLLLSPIGPSEGLSMMSPGYAAAALTSDLEINNYYRSRNDDVELSGWVTTLVFLVLAVFFYALTWIIFDRKMGRISRARPVALKDRSIWTKPVFGRGVLDVVE